MFLKLFKNKKIVFLNIFLLLYVGINLVTGERGLISYFEKKNYESKLLKDKLKLTNNLTSIEKKTNFFLKKLI